MSIISDSTKKVAPVLIIGGLIIVGAGIIVATNLPTFFPNQASVAEGATKLDKDIALGEAQIREKPTTTKPYITLSSLYLQKVRETSDAAYYAKIDALMDKAEKLDPNDGDIPAIRASTLIGRHLFKEAKLQTAKALTLNPTRPAYYGLDGDVAIELGQYTDAVTAFQKMVDLRPDFASWSRIAYIRELYGDVPGAILALDTAISSGSSYPENIAWAYVEKGKLLLRSNPAAAKESFGQALRVLPTYTQAMEGLGKVAFAEGDTKEAEAQFLKAYEGLPLAQYATDLGDLYGVEGNTTKAGQYYAFAQAALNTSAKSGVNTDLEESLFLSDHDMRPADALAKAQRAYEARPNIYGADYLSWALFKNGKIEEARTYTAEALRLGQHDSLILFHQGLIAKAAGDMIHAKEYLTKARALNPNFSVQYANVLKSELASLK